MNNASFKLVVLTTALATGALLAGHLYANPGDNSRQEMHRYADPNSSDTSRAVLGHLAKGIHQLDLSDTQKETIHEIFMSSKEDLKANHMAAKEGRLALHEILSASELDEEALADAARIEGDLLAERIMMSGSVAFEVLSELDEAQREELRTMVDHHKAKRQAHEGKRKQQHAGH